MRRGLYFVLMIVLVLRGLAGTAMAAGVLPSFAAQGVAEQHKGHQGHQHHHDGVDAEADAAKLMGATGPEHANFQGQQAAHVACDDATPGCAAHDHHSATCSACEICHSAMLDALARLTLPPAAPRSLLALAAAPFDSAPAALAIKPPIA